MPCSSGVFFYEVHCDVCTSVSETLRGDLVGGWRCHSVVMWSHVGPTQAQGGGGGYKGEDGGAVVEEAVGLRSRWGRSPPAAGGGTWNTTRPKSVPLKKQAFCLKSSKRYPLRISGRDDLVGQNQSRLLPSEKTSLKDLIMVSQAIWSMNFDVRISVVQNVFW